MVGIVVVTHGNIGKEMVEAARRIIPEAENLVAVSVEQNESPAVIRENISKAIAELKDSKNLLFATDMFGGTPSNICLSFLSKPNVEVVSGVNLPMLIKLASLKDGMSFEEIAPFIRQYGQKNIVIASEILNGKTCQK